MTLRHHDVVNKLAQDCHQIAREHGFWDYDGIPKYFQYSTKLALVHEETSEALRELRRVKSLEPSYDDEHWNKFADELVDIVIRVFDLGGDAGVDFANRLERIMGQNRNRPYRHGKLF